MKYTAFVLVPEEPVFIMHVSADDTEHAIEQAVNAYPMALEIAIVNGEHLIEDSWIQKN